MFDLHSHLLPGLDDGARDLAAAMEMARAYVDQGVTCVACTPHILPGLYDNSSARIRQAVADLQRRLEDAAIALKLVPGADNHVVPSFVAELKRGRLLSLADSRYVLVEPPHHVYPPRLEDLFVGLLSAGFVPLLTHPERLSWIETRQDVFERLFARGVWLQITSGSLSGKFGRRARYWAERMISEGRAHVLATDAHGPAVRAPDLADGYLLAERLAGAEEARHLVFTRPAAVLSNASPEGLPLPFSWKIATEMLKT